jgi:hypothetical protein
MKWSAHANRKLVEAIISAFHGSAEESYTRLFFFDERDWKRTYHWLDASGMALYFLDLVERLHIQAALPVATLARLRQNRDANRTRSEILFAEFASLNEAFQRAGLHYANLKGFSLAPDSCPDPVLRCTLDLDFLIDGNQLDACREILASTGYALCGGTNAVWEFRAGDSELARIEDHYHAKPQRSVELHFASSETAPYLPFRDGRLDRLERHTWNGITFPVLRPADQFILQALHIFQHLCCPRTRTAWLLEFKNHIVAREHDEPFWTEVQERSRHQRNAPIAIGLAVLLATRLFGGELPAQFEAWTIDSLPATVRLWADECGREAILADFPGTKLYLLLLEELAKDHGDWRKNKRRNLVPLRPAPRIVSPRPADGVVKRLRAEIIQARFLLFRLRFHVTAGVRYMIAAARWKRRLALLQEYRPDPIVD